MRKSDEKKIRRVKIKKDLAERGENHKETKNIVSDLKLH